MFSQKTTVLGLLCIVVALGGCRVSGRSGEFREGRGGGSLVVTTQAADPGLAEGACRVWYLDRPAAKQPPPGACDVEVPAGAVLITR